MRCRFARSVVICLSAMLACTLVFFIGKASAESAGARYTAGVWEGLSRGLDQDKALEFVGLQSFVSGRDELPEWFTDEIGDLPEGCTLVMNSAGDIVSFTIDGGIDEASVDLDSQLERHGWQRIRAPDDSTVNSGSVTDSTKCIRSQSTYIKEEGSCKWIVTSVQEIGDETVVVMHIQRE